MTQSTLSRRAGYTASIQASYGETFISNSTLGLYPRLVHERERLQSLGHGKWMGFAKAAGVAVLRTSQLHVRLAESRGGNKLLTTPFVFIGVNQYQITGWAIGQREDLDKGSLWLYSAPRRGPLGLVSLGLLALLGRLHHQAALAIPSLNRLHDVPVRRQRRPVRRNVVNWTLHSVQNKDLRPSMVMRGLFGLRLQDNLENANSIGVALPPINGQTISRFVAEELGD